MTGKDRQIGNVYASESADGAEITIQGRRHNFQSGGGGGGGGGLCDNCAQSAQIFLILLCPKR